MAKPNPILIKLYLENLLKALEEKQSQQKPTAQEKKKP